MYMPNEIDNKILRELVDNGMLPIEKATEVQKTLAAGAGDLQKLLVTEGDIDEDVFTQARASALGMPYVDIGKIIIPKDVLNIIPESTARGHAIVAYEQTPGLLKVAMADPSDRQIVEFIHKKVDMPVEVALTTLSAIKATLNHYQESLEIELQELIENTGQSISGMDDLNKVAEDLPTIKITDTILRHAIIQGASDIHIEPTEKKVVVRYRIDGILHDMLVLPKNVVAGLVARIKILSKLKIDEHRLPQDGRFKIESPDYQVAFRVSTLPVFDGEKIVMRLLDESGQGLGLDDMGMSPRTLEIFRNNVTKPHGMILVTGPTGSGKTTTLYAAMREINTPEVNISTIEDPIEYRMQRINQTQVQPKIGLTFSNGLRALVRQDPDVIMVGEIRDEETASLAVNAALTGHLVLSTLHTNSAAGALPRLLDMGVEPFLVASTANVLLAQRLVRRLCKDCRKENNVDKSMLDSLNQSFDIDVLLKTLKREGVVDAKDTWETIKFYTPVGCNKCREGYKGRLGIYEILEVTPQIQKMFSEDTTSKALEEKAREEQDMITIIEDGVIKVVQGMTTLEEVMRVAKE